MDRKNRPLSRDKKISEGSTHVGRRENSPPPPQQNNSSKRSTGKKRASPFLSVLGLIILLLFNGKEALSSVLGGMPSSQPSQSSGSSSQSPSGNPFADLMNSSVGSGNGNGNSGILNTNVSESARAKHTVLSGDGSDITTIMVYMCGTDLESNGGFATKDLQEMLSADIGDKINLLVFTGGCKQWQNQHISSSRNQIYKIGSGGMSRLWEGSQLQPMTDPATLSGFIQWGQKNFPADRYELIFWDHGGGSVSGYGYDEVYPRSGSMTLDGIATALKNGGCTFDFIGFDACLMATLETAMVCEPYADYLIASEETEPGCGWYYTDWLTALSSNPSMPALEIGKHIADDFVKVCGQVAARQQATLSVIDLAEMAGTVPESFNAFALSATKQIESDDYKSIASARNCTKEFAASSDIDQVDLIHLADNVGTTESRRLSNVLREAVKYNITSNNIQNANGVSIYFPYGRMSNVNRMANTYDKIGLDEAYTRCIKSFASLEVAGQTVSGGSSAQLESLFGSLLSGGSSSAASSQGTVSSDMIAQLLGSLMQGSGRSLEEVGLNGDEAGFIDDELLEDSTDYLAANQFDTSALVWTEKDGQRVLSLTEDQWGLVQDVELNVFVDDGAGYIDLGLDNVFSFNDSGDLIGEYDKTWLCVNGQAVAYYMLSSEGTEDDYKITGCIPALLNGQRVNLMVSFTDEYPDGEILGAAICYNEESETDTIARGLLEIKDGDVIDFLCDYYDYNRNFQDSFYLGDKLTVSGPLELSNMKMDNTSFITAYRITDIYHNHYWTPSI